MDTLQLRIEARSVTYKCFNCLKLKNPIADRPVLTNAILAMAPGKDGGINMKISAVHMCESCYNRAARKGKFCTPEQIDPNIAKKAPQVPSIIDSSTEIPPKK